MFVFDLLLLSVICFLGTASKYILCMIITAFIDIDKDTPVFNEWFDKYEHFISCDVIELDDDDNDRISTESPPKITKGMEMIGKLHLLAITQQPQLHP
jgi:hypothetical protein